jgi:hypothetical protein
VKPGFKKIWRAWKEAMKIDCGKKIRPGEPERLVTTVHRGRALCPLQGKDTFSF